jgi:hypothetical protein
LISGQTQHFNFAEDGDVCLVKDDISNSASRNPVLELRMSSEYVHHPTDQLRLLRDEKKFVERPYYPGAPTEEIRIESERRINEFLDDTVALLEAKAQRDEIFARARELLRAFSFNDTEEKERADDYVGQAMRILGFDDWAEHI